ncbi:recombinase family protein [Acetobacter sacchari]|uniref:Recombinase family protein n=1 Tax=Acetobacter sacchari TaxID=2661687 RepID=A0ABS3LWG7_9PROT|nr:recombinase family protein [Acetobacter sacchari]
MNVSASRPRGQTTFVGYARVSTEDQRLDLQLRALRDAGCQQIFTDQGESGGSFTRSGLEAAMRSLRPGQTLVVWRLDRLGRSLAGLVNLMDELGSLGIHFRSITEHIDTASSGGRLMFHMMAALAEFERSIIAERTKAGLDAARARGKKLGRPRLLSDGDLALARQKLAAGKENLRQVANFLKVSTRTLARYLGPTDHSRKNDSQHQEHSTEESITDITQLAPKESEIMSNEITGMAISDALENRHCARMENLPALIFPSIDEKKNGVTEKSCHRRGGVAQIPAKDSLFESSLLAGVMRKPNPRPTARRTGSLTTKRRRNLAL